MMKMVTWISLALTILGAIADFTRPDGSGEDAAEVAMMVKLLAGGDTPAGGQPVTSPQKP